MADTFPTALQRTSDERWVTLDVVAREDDRVIARIAEAPAQAAVIRPAADAAYDEHLRRLLASPPPDAGRHVHMAWPVDLLHDMDAGAIGYTVRRAPTRRSFPLADLVDPGRRVEVAPSATRRHLLRVARNVATATAALHHAGHGRVRGAQFRVDDRAHVLVVRVDELRSDASAAQRAEDERRLGHLIVRMLSGQPWSGGGSLGELLRTAADPTTSPVAAQEWFFALREAERSLPRTPAVLTRATPTAPPQEPVSFRPLDQAMREVRGGGPATDDRGRSAAHAAAIVPTAAETSDRGRSAAHAAAIVPTAAEISDRGRSAAHAAAIVPTAAVRTGAEPGGDRAGDHRPRSGPIRRSDRRRRAHRDGRHLAATANTAATTTATTTATVTALPPAGPARPVFAVAAGLTFGVAASVAPFAAFLLVSCGMIVKAAVDVGRRKATRGPHQIVAIILSRLVPFATGGLALAAFVLLDLLLVLGLCMALGERLFGYGPGFTLTWVLQLPEVPGLVRAFAFCVGAFGGMSLGGETYDRIRAGGRRMILTPAIAVSLAAGILLVDAHVVWWPLPLIA